MDIIELMKYVLDVLTFNVSEDVVHIARKQLSVAFYLVIKLAHPTVSQMRGWRTTHC